jgi:hypothetical protein
MEVSLELPMEVLKRDYKNKITRKYVNGKLTELYSDIRKTTPIHIDFQVSPLCSMPLLSIARKAINYVYAPRNDKVIVDIDIKYIDKVSDKIGVVIKRADDYAPFDLTGRIIDLYIAMKPFSYWCEHKVKKNMFKEFFKGLSHIEGSFNVQIEFGFAKYSEANSKAKWKISFPDVDNCARGVLSQLDSNKVISIKMRKINTMEDYIHVVLIKAIRKGMENKYEEINDI